QAANEQLRVALSENQQLLERTKRAYLSTIKSLARTIEAKDPYTGGHTERVSGIALMIAEDLGFDGADLDIGKIGVPDDVLLKPGTLESTEIDTIRQHPVIASYILAELELPAIVKQMT